MWKNSLGILSMAIVFLIMFSGFIFVIVDGSSDGEHARQYLENNGYKHVEVGVADARNCPEFTWRTTRFDASAMYDDTALTVFNKIMRDDSGRIVHRIRAHFVYGVVCRSFSGKESLRLFGE